MNSSRASRSFAFAAFSSFVALAACTAAPSASAVPGSPATPAAPSAPLARISGPADAVMHPGPKPIDVRAAQLPSGIDRDWVTKDAEMIWRVRTMLPPGAGARAFFKGFEGVRTADLGFGYERRIAQLGGGTASCTFTGISHDDALVELHTQCTSSANAADTLVLKPTLDAAFGPAWTFEPAHGGSWNADYTFPASDAVARASVDKELGALTPVDPGTLPSDIAQAYALLMSVRDDVVVGDHCGFGGATPPAKLASDTLASAHRDDLLRNVLRGSNPGARVYAARALTSLGAMSAADAALVKKLEAASTPITTCDGCMVHTITTRDALTKKL